MRKLRYYKNERRRKLSGSTRVTSVTTKFQRNEENARLTKTVIAMLVSTVRPRAARTVQQIHTVSTAFIAATVLRANQPSVALQVALLAMKTQLFAVGALAKIVQTVKFQIKHKLNVLTVPLAISVPRKK